MGVLRLQALGLSAVSPGGTWETIPTGGKGRRSSTGGARKPRCRAEHCCAGAEGRRDRARTEAHGQGDSAAAAPGLAAAQPTAQAARAGCAGLNCTAWPYKGARRAPTHFVDQRAGHGIPAVLRCLHSHSQELVSAGCSLRLRQRTCAGWVAWTEPSILAEPVRGAVAQRGLPQRPPICRTWRIATPLPGLPRTSAGPPETVASQSISRQDPQVRPGQSVAHVRAPFP